MNTKENPILESRRIDHMIPRTKSIPIVVGLWTLGLACLALAALTTSASIEQTLLGKATGKLQWGPALFRGLLAFHGLAAILGGIYYAGLRRRQRGFGEPSPESSFGSDFMGDSKSSRSAWIVLFLLCAAALGLRLRRLNTCLWFDEVLTVVDFLRLPLREIVAVFPSQNQHMLYSVLGRVSFVLFDESAAAARVPAVFFGVASLWALFVLGRRMNGTRETLLACAIMAFSYHHVWFSQNARGYTGLLFFTILSTWCWLHALDSGKAPWWVGYAASVSLGMWVHMTLMFVVAAHGIAYLGMLLGTVVPKKTGGANGRSRKWPWQAPLAWLFAISATLQLHALSLPEFLRSALHEESLDSEWTNPWWLIRETLQRLADGGFVGVAALGALVVLALGLGSLARHNRVGAAVMVLPALFGGATMLAMGHNLWPRFFFFCMGFFLLMAVRGATICCRIVLTPLRNAASRSRWTTRLSTAGCLAVVLASALTVPRVYALPKQDFTGARDYVESIREPSDATVAVGLAGVAYRRYFAPDWTVVEDRAALEALGNRQGTVWLVYTLPPQLKAWYPDIWDAVQSKFEEVKVFPGTLGGGEVYVYRRTSGNEPVGRIRSD